MNPESVWRVAADGGEPGLSVVLAAIGVVVEVIAGLEEAGIGEVGVLVDFGRGGFVLAGVGPLGCGREGVFPVIGEAFEEAFAFVELTDELLDIVVVNAVAWVVGQGGDGVAGIPAGDLIELAQANFVLPDPEARVVLWRAPAEDDAVGIDRLALLRGGKWRGREGGSMSRGLFESEPFAWVVADSRAGRRAVSGAVRWRARMGENPLGA